MHCVGGIRRPFRSGGALGNFIQSLIIRGMNRPLTVTSDDHIGIRAALAHTLAGALWQRCQLLFQQNSQAYVTTTRYKSIAAAHIRSIFNAGS